MGRLTHISNAPLQISPRSIIVLTREHIGDLIGTTPALRSLRRRFPKAHIAVEVGERAACILENNPNVDEIILRKEHQGAIGKLDFIRLLRRRKFDLGVILDDSSGMILNLWLGGISHRVGILRKKKYANLLTQSIYADRSVHETIDNFLAVVELLGGDINDRKTEVFPTQEDESYINELLSQPLTPSLHYSHLKSLPHATRLIALNPGASLPANRWLPERFSELNNLLAEDPNTRVLLLGGGGDLQIADQILSDCILKPLALTGKLTVMQLARLLKRCAYLVTGDTGPMHLAVAVGTPVVALFGPADPNVSGPGVLEGNVILRKVASCPECTKQHCTKDNGCMRAISAEEVVAACSKKGG